MVNCQTSNFRLTPIASAIKLVRLLNSAPSFAPNLQHASAETPLKLVFWVAALNSGQLLRGCGRLCGYCSGCRPLPGWSRLLFRPWIWEINDLRLDCGSIHNTGI